MDVREFRNGSIEVLLKVLPPLHEGPVISVANPDSHLNYLKSIDFSYKELYGSGLNKIVDEKTGHESEFRSLENHLRAVRRAKAHIRWLVNELDADRLLTLTYRANETDRDKVKADFKRFVRLVRKGWGGQQGFPDWRYVAVLERQDRGAYHIHCGVKGWQKISFLRAAWFKALGGSGFETGAETPGNIDVTSPRKCRWGTSLREWKASKLSAYLTKYLSKTFDSETEEKKRYWHSKDLSVPVRKRFILCAVDLAGAIRELASIVYFHFGIGIDFSRSWMSPGKNSLWLSLGEVT
jgi:hypothetical protein